MSGGSRVRWQIVALLTGFSVVSYVARMNISVAAEPMMPELGLTQVQMGQVFSAFLLGYALLQIPLGMMGDALGSYRTLATVGWAWALLSLATGWLPGTLFVSGTGAFVALLVIRFLLGCSVAATYPMAARTVAAWHPRPGRAFAYSFVVAGVFIGSAVTPPIIAWMMATVGWRHSFTVAAVLAAMIAGLWGVLGASRPGECARVDAGELALIDAGGGGDMQPARASWRVWRAVLADRSLAVLSLSYFLMGYVLYVFVFWFFLYLVDARGFGIVEGGLVASLPFLTAAVLSPIGGTVSDRGTARWGARWGRRIPGMVGPSLAGACLWYGVRTESLYLAIAALALSFGLAEFAEGTVWSTAMDVGRERTGMVTGIINTANNLGGVVSTALMPVLVERIGWTAALDSCALLAVVAGLLWLGVRADRPLSAVAARDE